MTPTGQFTTPQGRPERPPERDRTMGGGTPPPEHRGPPNRGDGGNSAMALIVGALAVALIIGAFFWFAGDTQDRLIWPRQTHIGGIDDDDRARPCRTPEPPRRQPSSAQPTSRDVRGAMARSCPFSKPGPMNAFPSPSRMRPPLIPPRSSDLLDACFGLARRTKTTYRLREGEHPVAALCHVARDPSGRLIGAISFWDLRIGEAGAPALLLGPVAVAPDLQGKGIGRSPDASRYRGLTRARAQAHRAGGGRALLRQGRISPGAARKTAAAWPRRSGAAALSRA
jgi:GNAT superfamily N-acetyltransferase